MSLIKILRPLALILTLALLNIWPFPLFQMFLYFMRVTMKIKPAMPTTG